MTEAKKDHGVISSKIISVSHSLLTLTDHATMNGSVTVLDLYFFFYAE